MSERVLVIGAHVDDESFGCLGTLLKHKEAGDTLGFAHFSYGRNTLSGYKKLKKYFNQARYKKDYWFKDQKLDTYPLINLVKHIEEVVAVWNPTIVYCPFIGDLNRDHRIVAEATMVACRPYLPNAPKEVWMYQIPGSTELGMREFNDDKIVEIDYSKKWELIEKWYPEEMINGRGKEHSFDIECFEKWPR